MTGRPGRRVVSAAAIPLAVLALQAGATACSDDAPRAATPSSEATPAPDTDPEGGRLTPELARVDPCALLIAAEVGRFLPDGPLEAAEDDLLRTDHRQCTWRSVDDGATVTLQVAALAADLVTTLEASVPVTNVEEVLGLPGPAVVATDPQARADAVDRAAIGLAVDLGGGYHLVLLPGSSVPVATPAWEAFLDLARSAAPRLDP